MNKINHKRLGLFCLTAMFFFQACKKDKVDFEADNRVLQENRVNSNARIVNLAGLNQVVFNNDSLTNFVVRHPNAPDWYKFPGTDYFPVNGQLGKSWYIPQNLFNAQETVQLKLGSRNFQGSNDFDLELTAKNDYNNPTDYYLMPTFFMSGQPAIVPVKRGVSTPSKPDHFKIRIVNLSGRIKNPGNNSNGQLEDLTGSVSLAYANGALVAPQTNNISSAIQTSEYVELPYGTYQFKVLMQDGRQMPALGSENYDFTVIDPPTSTIPNSINSSTNLTYAPIQTYQPGGIYTIVIAPQRFRYLINEMSETSDTYQNSFQIINDNSAAANNTYFRLQGANAWNTASVSFRVDGKTLGSNLGVGTAGDYMTLVQGNHTIEAMDASGKVIASANQILRPAQNYTAWLYPDQSGAAKLIIVANDLSGATFTGGTQDDATFSRNQFRYFFFKRFLNLSVGNPYITFTLSDGQSAATIGYDNLNAGVNLQPGVPVFEKPYVSSGYAQSAFQVMAYRSKPNVVPGLWANDIEALKSEVFIADKTLYQKPGRAVPVQEAGIYTVALIGQSGSNSTTANKARMIIVKHNK
uniref:DUF4397 domain-containing protein n=1 Tax=Pedobacter schmidteae TaxID=2201271 RepID=UPI000EB0A96A|nr:DUF4397 domain-containing protein [Pedobacter schmidteae]